MPVLHNHGSLCTWGLFSETREATAERSLHTEINEQPPLNATRENSRAVVKTQRSQKFFKKKRSHLTYPGLPGI